MSSTSTFLSNEKTIFSLLTSCDTNNPVFIDSNSIKTWADIKYLASSIYTKIQNTSNIEINNAIIASDNAMILLSSIIACWCNGIIPNFPNGLELENINDIVSENCIVIAENTLFEKYNNRISANIIYVSPNDSLTLSTNFDEKIKWLANNRNLELQQKIVQFTTGTTSTPKKIIKEIKDFYIESKVIVNNVLNKTTLMTSKVLATVPCFHAYGFMFRFLIPILNNTISFSKMIIYPEQFEVIAKKYNNLTLISSPGFLKRMDGISETNTVNLLLSAGGKIDERTQNSIERKFSVPAIDILGSTETGIIGYRESSEKTSKFQVVKTNKIFVFSNSKAMLLPFGQGTLAIESEYIPNHIKKHICDQDEIKHNVFVSNDIAEITSNNSFVLHGREGRIVKIEDNRISLDSIENCLTKLPYIQDVAVIPINLSSRETVAACITLTDVGSQIYNKTTKGKFIIKLRNDLKQINKIAVPKKIIIVQSMPQTPNGKTDYRKIKEIVLNEISTTNQS